MKFYEFALILLLLIFLINNSIYSQIPDWIEKGRSIEFPSDRYIHGIGIKISTGNEDDDRKSADNNAREQIAQQIMEKIVSVTDGMVEEAIKSGGGNFAIETFKNKIYSSINLTLRNVEIKERWFDVSDKIYYSLAVLNKKKMVENLVNEIPENYKLVNDFIKKSEEYVSTGNIQFAIKGYFRAAEKLTEIIEQETIRNILRGSEFTVATNAHIMLTYIENEVARIRDKLYFETLDCDEQVIFEDGLSEKDIKVKLSYKNNREIPQKNFPLLFFLVDKNGKIDRTGQIQGKVFTDSDGIATSRIKGLDHMGNDQRRIFCTLDLAEIYPGNSDLYNIGNLPAFGTEIRFTRKTETLDMSIAKAVNNLNKNTPKKYQESDVVMGNITYKDTKIASSFVKYLNSIIVNNVKKQKVFNIIDREKLALNLGESNIGEFSLIAQSADEAFVELRKKVNVYVLGGNYWDDRNNIRLNLMLLNGNTGNRISSASETIPKKMIPENILLVPENFQEIQSELQDMIGIAEVKKPQDFRIELWVDKGDGGVYEKEEKLFVYLRANRNCFVRLIYHQADGTNVQIYPNRFGQYNMIESDKVYVIPDEDANFDFLIREPFGSEVLTVFASTIDFEDEQQNVTGPVLLAGTTRSIFKNYRERGIEVRQRHGEFAEASCVITTIANLSKIKR